MVQNDQVQPEGFLSKWLYLGYTPVYLALLVGLLVAVD
jgi:hypothetical protein